MKKAFTLIELLVVIAIIGLIASIVLVNLRGIREKARVAKSQSFSQSVNHALGAYAVGVWRFERVDGSNYIYDESGYNSHCLLYETAALNDKGIMGKALELDGDGDYADCGSGPSFHLTDKITVEAWIYPESFNPSGYSSIVRHFGWAYDGTFFMGQLGAYEKWGFSVRAGSDNNWVSFSAEKTLNTWTHIASVCDGEKNYIYKNGELMDSVTLAATPVFTRLPDRMPIQIGEYYSFDGLIDEVRIYNEALTTGQIQKHYAEGLGRYRLTKK